MLRRTFSYAGMKKARCETRGFFDFSGSLRRQRDVLFLVIIKRGNNRLRVFRVGAMQRFTVVNQVFHRKPFGVTRGFRTPSPSVTVAVQGNALNFQAAAGAGKLGRPMRLAHGFQLGEQWAGGRQVAQHSLQFIANADGGSGSCLVSVEGNNARSPVNVLGGKCRNVGLCAADMPATFVKRPPFDVLFSGNNVLMLG
jgi:hypothetical protein